MPRNSSINFAIWLVMIIFVGSQPTVQSWIIRSSIDQRKPRCPSAKKTQTADEAPKPTTTKRKKKTVVEGPRYWLDPNDDPLIVRSSDNHTVVTSLEFRIHGNPLPLQRHRQTRKGFVYNPSAAAQDEFFTCVKEALPDLDTVPLFPAHIPLQVECTFALKRPQADFVASTRGRPLKASKRSGSTFATAPRTPDVDNLAKFVLDSLNGRIYDDDSQVVSLNILKKRDNQGECWGHTNVVIRIFEEETEVDEDVSFS